MVIFQANRLVHIRERTNFFSKSNFKLKNCDKVYDINKNMVGNTLMSEIIINRNGEILSSYNGISYILIKIFSMAKRTKHIEFYF